MNGIYDDDEPVVITKKIIKKVTTSALYEKINYEVVIDDDNE